MALTYASYLQTDELLALQRPLSPGPEHDEHLFIVVHQVHELWFKQILHELDQWCRRMQERQISLALGTLRRVMRIVGLLNAQSGILETMTPIAFSSFRQRLETASGFQSAQFREIEALLGIHNTGLPEEPQARAKLVARREAPNMWAHFVRYAKGLGLTLAPDGENPAQDEALLDLYRHHPQAANLAERLVDLDAGIQEWRYRHIKMVQRTIGAKLGSAGSAGVAYLESTLSKVAFPALWRVRTLM